MYKSSAIGDFRGLLLLLLEWFEAAFGVAGLTSVGRGLAGSAADGGRPLP